jgi:protein subunit release factor A
MCDGRIEPMSEKDLRVDFYDNASPGDSYRVSCRMVHVPSGTVAQSEQHQSRLMAKRQAFDRLLEGLNS